MKPSLSAGPTTDTSLSGYATERNDYPATPLKAAGAWFLNRSMTWPNPTTPTVKQQACKQKASRLYLELIPKGERQSGEFLLLQRVGGGGGDGGGSSRDLNLQVRLKQSSSVQVWPVGLSWLMTPFVAFYCAWANREWQEAVLIHQESQNPARVCASCLIDFNGNARISGVDSETGVQKLPALSRAKYREGRICL